MSDVIWIDSEQQFNDIIAEGGKVVVDFTAPAWCRPCMAFAPHFERAASELKDVKFLAVDVDNHDWPMVEYGVQGVPTVFVFDGGEQVATVPAPQGAITFIAAVKAA